jgi:hypothetical protein
MKKKKFVVGLMLICFLSVAAVPAAQAFGLGDIFKVGGVSFLVDKFSGPLNSFINTLTFKHGASTNFATKVVPIISFGNGSYVGAAQVTGPQDLVNQTQAVLQLESDFAGQFHIQALVPIDSKNPVHFSRVNGVGVSAVIGVQI